MNYFNPGAFVSNFHYLVSGMLGIFLVIGIIILFYDVAEPGLS